ncbi:hypothetical protein C8J45_103149 [Sphingomonas sp. PP-CE-3G-477]|nr:hypothetical protein C8J45_103149 [Sphingomonas sp. PP-CE-3G-477]
MPLATEKPARSELRAGFFTQSPDQKRERSVRP